MTKVAGSTRRVCISALCSADSLVQLVAQVTHGVPRFDPPLRHISDMRDVIKVAAILVLDSPTRATARAASTAA